MSDDTKPEHEGKSLEEQLREMLGKANLSMFMSRPDGGAESVEPVEAPVEPEDKSEALEVVRSFDLKPRDIYAYLDRFVIEQNEAKKVLSVAICDHYNHVRRCVDDEAATRDEYAKHMRAIMQHAKAFNGKLH